MYRVGDGVTALANTGNAIFLDEYTISGSLVQSIALPTTTSGANSSIFASGTATSEGMLQRSADKQYLTFAGYASTDPGGVANTTSATNNRVVGIVRTNGVVDTSTKLSDWGTNNNPRSVVSTNGTDLYLAGATGGVRYTTVGSTTSTQLSTTVTNIRTVDIYGGQLYSSENSGAFRISTVGTGTPTTSGQTITNLPGIPVSNLSPYQFFFADLSNSVAGVDTLYFAEDTAATGGIKKYSLVGGTWVANGTITGTGVRGLTASVTGSTVNLYSTGGATSNTIFSLSDTSGYNANITGTLAAIATAGSGTAFRGIDFAPEAAAATPEASTFAMMGLGLLPIAAVAIRRRKATKTA